MTDNEIIEHLKNNQYSTALKGLYNVLPVAKKYVLNNNGTADDAQDTFQDALVVLYKNVHTPGFVLTAGLKTYLLAIVKNCWLNELRRRKRLPAGDISNDIPDSNNHEEPAMALAGKAFELLGEKCKALLISFYYKKLSFKEIAAALSFSDEKTAKNQKYRCLQKAKENYLTLSNSTAHE